MCYWEKNIRKQIEIAFLQTDFFRILLNKLPLCSASSYSWTSSRKSNLELIKKKCNACDEVAFSCSWSRLLCWSTSASIWIIHRHFVFQDWEIYIHKFKNSNCQQKGLKSCNLSLSPALQEQFFLSMFKVWRKNFRLSTIWQIFGFFSVRKRENCMHICMRKFVKSPIYKNFFIFTLTKKNSQELASGSQTGLKQASADKTENVYLSFAALLSWNGQLSVLLVKTQWCRN